MSCIQLCMTIRTMAVLRSGIISENDARAGEWLSFHALPFLTVDVAVGEFSYRKCENALLPDIVGVLLGELKRANNFMPSNSLRTLSESITFVNSRRKNSSIVSMVIPIPLRKRPYC